MMVELLFCDRNGNSREPIQIEWDCDHFPKAGDFFNLDDFVYLQFDLIGLCWTIVWISWGKRPKGVYATICLENEFQETKK